MWNRLFVCNGPPFYMRDIESSRLLADVSKNTAIDIENVAIDGVGGMRGKEHGGSAQFLGLEPTAGRCLGTDERVEGMAAAIRLTLAQRCCLWRSDIARANAVALDVVLAIL